MTEHHNIPQSGLFKHKPEDIELRRKCIKVAREYHAALERANKSLLETDKLLESTEIIDDKQYRIYESLLKEIDNCLLAADWSVSLFFQGMGNRIKLLRDQLKTGLEKYEVLSEATKNTNKKITKEGSECVFISLYLADGKVLSRWIGVLNSLTRLSIGRPVYRNEAHIIDMIRAKVDQTRDAYVAVNIHADDILPPIGGIELTDRLGHELITIREGVISSNNIKEFVQVNERVQKRYRFEKGQLILITDAD